MVGSQLVVMTAHDHDRADSIRLVKERATSMSDAAVTVWVEPMATPTKALGSMLSFRPKSLICMSTSARTGVRRAVYGSLAERLLRAVDAPLLLVGPRWAGAPIADLRHLVVCVDGSPTAEAAIPLAGTWLDALALNVTMLHVRAGGDAFHVDLDRLASPLEQRCEIVDRAIVDSTDVVEGILDVVRHSVSPMVVMATHGRGGVDRMLHGSVMASLISRCEVPILVQRGPLPVTRLGETGPAPGSGV
jgi:nucleotide-binding universal stress UspA family protein